MYLGRIVEFGDAKEIFRDPKHPYTQALLAAIPSPDPDARRLKALPRGEVPDAIHPPAGCRFHPRCPVATPTCGWEPADIFDVLDRRALDDALRKRDEEVLGQRERMTVAGPTLRVRAIDPGLSRRERRVLGAMTLLAGLAFFLIDAPVGVAVWATGLLAVVAVHVLARREAFRTNRVGKAAERVRAHLEEVLRSGPEPLAQAVRKIEVVRDEVLVEFAPAADPGLRKVDGREVRCVLY
jgi:oligopeptide/dipeptide ABC transporter ATP-binding protein